MVARFIVSIIFTTVLFSSSSCRKCTVCTYTDPITFEDEIEEYCGTKKQVQDFETNWAEDNKLFGPYCLQY